MRRGLFGHDDPPLRSTDTVVAARMTFPEESLTEMGTLDQIAPRILDAVVSDIEKELDPVTRNIREFGPPADQPSPLVADMTALDYDTQTVEAGDEVGRALQPIIRVYSDRLTPDVIADTNTVLLGTDAEDIVSSPLLSGILDPDEFTVPRALSGLGGAHTVTVTSGSEYTDPPAHTF